MTRPVRAVAFVFCVLVLGCKAEEPKELDPREWLQDGKLTFSFPDLAGNMVSSEDPRFENKVVLLDVWGTWCPPCRKMTPFLEELDARYASEGLEIVGVAFELLPDDGGEDPQSLVSSYVADNDLHYLSLYGGYAEHPSSLVFSKLSFLQFDGFPTVVIRSRDGTVRMIEDGFDRDKASRMESLVQELLASPV